MPRPPYPFPLALPILLLAGFPVVPGCSEYGFGKGEDGDWVSGEVGEGGDLDGDGAPNGGDDDDDGDGIEDWEDDDDDGDGIPDEDDPDGDNDGIPDRDDPDDDDDGIPDTDDPDDDGDGIPDTDDPDGGDGGPDDPDDPPPDFDDCEDGYWADYFNLPADHADIEGSVTGVITGDVPATHDWWDPAYWVWRTVDPNLEFGTGWWPVDTGLDGDPQYFAVYWFAWLDVTQSGDVVFELASDDDGWAMIDGEIVADLGGIHGVAVTEFTLPLDAGTHSLQLFFAERHTSESGFWFKWNSDHVRFLACP